MSQPANLGDFHAVTIDGKDQDLGTYVGESSRRMTKVG